MVSARRIAYRAVVSILLWATAGHAAPPARPDGAGTRDSLSASRAGSSRDSISRISDSTATVADSSPGIAGQAAPDTGDSASVGAPVKKVGSTQQRPAPAPVDSLGMFLDNPRHGLGIGWTLGSFGLFSEWEDGLPDSLGDLQLAPSAIFVDLGLGMTDIYKLRFVVREKPDAYNINFPLHLSWVPRAHRSGFLTIESSAYYAGKTWLGAVEADSLHYKLEIDHRLSFVSFSLGTAYSFALPQQYFRIDGVDASYLVAGIGISPLSALFQVTSFTKNGSLPDSLAPLSSYLDTAKQAFTDHTSLGFGLTWQFGISTLKLSAAGRGVSFGISYVGQWYGFFYEDGSRLAVNAVNPRSRSPRDALASLSHRLEIQAQLVGGTRPPRVVQGTTEP